jgi:rod shape determining protein RodA
VIGIDRRLLWNVDWVLVATTYVLAAIGVAVIFSATQTGRFAGAHSKQAYAMVLGTGAMIVAASIDYRRLADRSPLLYLAIAGVLLYVLLYGPRIAGTRRWLQLGPLQIQPSELAKIVVALLVAKVFSESRKESLGLPDLLAPGAAVGVLFLLIAREPDLGSAICLVPILLTAAVLAGLRGRAMIGLLVGLVMVGGVAWQFGLKDYQKDRIYNFLEPGRDPRGAGYQRTQSQIAVGSGGLTGKGYMKGSQNQLAFLPARHTDFVFSVLAEEWGFVGVTVVLAIYLLWLFRCFEAARMARDRLGAFLAAGIAGGLCFQVVYNVAMVAGLVPVKGLPLPLLSYGGSSIISTFVGVGLVLNVRMRRFAN